MANQAERVYRQYPEVDVVVNSEGEFVFRDLLLAYLAEREPAELTDVGGISLLMEPGQVLTTPSPDRIQDLNDIGISLANPEPKFWNYQVSNNLILRDWETAAR